MKVRIVLLLYIVYQNDFVFRRCLSFSSIVSTTHQVNDNKDGLLILGYGRVGREVAKLVTDDSRKGSYNGPFIARVVGTVRSSLTTNTTQSLCKVEPSISLIQFDEIDILRSIAKDCRYVFVTIPPFPNKPDDDNTIEAEMFETVLQEIICEILPGSWVGLISTTGIYGNHDGSWVTEDSQPFVGEIDRTLSSTALNYLPYESKWSQWTEAGRHSLRVFRCAGIYSNDQSALHTVYRNGISLSLPEFTQSSPQSQSSDDSNVVMTSITNRIHVHDIARAVLASMKQHNFQESEVSSGTTTSRNEILDTRVRVFNLADNYPENRDIVLTYAAKLLESIGVSVERRVGNRLNAFQVSDRARRRSTDRKRVSNQRLLTELLPDIGLKYPTYKEGLLDILNDKTNPWWK